MSDKSRLGEDDRDMSERVRELEARLADMERGARIRERARSRFDRVVPPEAIHHFRSAGREQLLGVRTLVDHWITHLDGHEETSETPERETIEVR